MIDERPQVLVHGGSDEDRRRLVDVLEKGGFDVQTAPPDRQARPLSAACVERCGPEETVLESEMLKSAAVPLVLLDREGRIRLFNRAAEAASGLTREQAIGRLFSESLPRHDEVERLRHALEQAWAERQPVEIEIHWVSEPGRERLIIWTLRAVGGSGRFLVLTGRDAIHWGPAERKNHSLAQFVLDTPNPVMRIDREGTLLEANGAAAPVVAEWGIAVGGQVPPSWRDLVREALSSGSQRVVEIPIGRSTINFILKPKPDAGSVDLYGRDVSERKRAEEALQESEARLRKLFENMPVICFTFDRDGRVLSWNMGAEQVYGYSSAEAIGERLETLGLFSGAGVGFCAEVLDVVFSGRSWLQREWQDHDRRGRGGWRVGNLFPLLKASGAVECGVNLSLDVTAQRQAAISLKEREERLALAVRGANLGLWEWDVATGKTVCSERWGELLGCPADGIPTQMTEWFELTHPDDRGVLKEALNDHLDGKRPVFQCEHRLKNRAGDYCWVWALGKVLERDAGGRPARAAGTLMDISEHKAAERAMRVVQYSVDRARDGIFWLRTDGTLFFVNDAGCRALGYTREEVLNQPISMVDPDFPIEVWPGHLKDLEQRGAITFESRHRRKDGTIFPVEVTSNYIEFEGERGSFAFAHDITERKRAETALRESEKSYRDLFNATNEAIFIHDGETGAILEVNAPMLEMYGFSEADIPSLTTADCTSGDPVEALAESRRRIQMAVKEGPQLFEWPAKRKDGSCFWAEVALRSTTLRGATRVLAVVRDVSGRKQAEKRRRLAEVSIERNQDAIFWVEMDGRFFDVNQKACETLGYAREELLQMRAQEIDPLHAFGGWEGLIEQLSRRRSMVFQSTQIRKDGVVFPVEITADCLDFEDQRVLFAFVRDISQRLAEEQRTIRFSQRLQHLVTIDRAILAAESPPAIAETALPTVRTILGCQRVSLVRFDLEQGLASILAVDAEAPTRLGLGDENRLEDFAVSDALKEGRFVLHNELTAESAQSVVDHRLLEEGIRSYLCVPLMAQGQLIGAMNVGSYRSHAFGAEEIEMAQEIALSMTIAVQQGILREQIRKYTAELEQRVAERTAQLEEAIQEMEAFSYSVSHDLRAPLRAVTGFSRILQEEHGEQLDPSGHRLLGMVIKNTRQMGELIDDLLAFARIGRQSLNRKRIAVQGVVMEALAALGVDPTAPGPDLELVLGPLPDVDADPNLLRQVFVNLLSNALKFSQDRSPARVEVRSCLGRDLPALGLLPREDQAAATVVFVRDNGVGFDMKYSNQIFGVFNRLHRTEEFEGTGVGLAIVQRIIQRHGGTVWAEGRLGSGATILFTL